MDSATVIPFTPRSVAPPGEIEAACRNHLARLRCKGYAANTVASYQRDLEQFAGYLAARGLRLIQSVDPRHLDGFVDALVQGEGVSTRSASRKMATVRGLFRFAILEGMIPPAANPCDRVDPVRFQARRVIAPSETKLLELIDSIPTASPLDLRDRALFRVMFDSACRVGGVLSLDVYDDARPPPCHVHPKSGVVLYRAKGGRIKDSVVDDASLVAMAQWLEVRGRLLGKHQDPALFISREGQRMTRAAVHYRLKQHGARVGMPNMHCHLFRHRRVGDVLEKTDPYTAQALSGHERISTLVDVYGAHNRERLRARLRRHAPLGGATC